MVTTLARAGKMVVVTMVTMHGDQPQRAEPKAVDRMAMSYGARSQGPEKRYVAVDVHMAIDGSITPQRIYWKDGRVFELAESVSLGADSHEHLDLRYKIRIRGRKDFTYLWMDEVRRWYVKEKPRKPNLEEGA